jgi:hypothetical protein
VRAVYYLRKRIGRAAKRALGLQTFPPGRYRHIYEEIERLRPKRILEVGTNDGINAVEMIRVARRSGVSVDYFGFDLFEALDRAELRREFSIRTRSRHEVARHLRRNGVSSAQLVAGDTRKTLPEAARTLAPMDLIFIDGGHSYETVLSDWTSVEPLISDTTSVFFDDYPNFGIGPVVDQIDRSAWDVTIFPTVDRFEIKDPSFGSERSASTLEVQVARARRRK